MTDQANAQDWPRRSPHPFVGITPPPLSAAETRALRRQQEKTRIAALRRRETGPAYTPDPDVQDRIDAAYRRGLADGRNIKPIGVAWGGIAEYDPRAARKSEPGVQGRTGALVLTGFTALAFVVAAILIAARMMQGAGA